MVKKDLKYAQSEEFNQKVPTLIQQNINKLNTQFN